MYSAVIADQVSEGQDRLVRGLGGVTERGADAGAEVAHTCEREGRRRISAGKNDVRLDGMNE